MAYENNLLSKIIVHISANSEPSFKELKLSLNGISDIYSYLIYAKYDNKKLTGWQVEMLISQTNRFNTIPSNIAIKNITKIVLDDWKENKAKYVIGYKQPCLDLMVEIYSPLIKKLAKIQKLYWQDLDYEDLCQTCNLVITVLYRKGYYIHKKLLSRAFTNYVLGSIRKERYKPVMTSLDEPMASDGEGNDISVVDFIVDEQAENEIFEQYELEHTQYIIEQKREIIIEKIGKRSYDQLLREYGNGLTTNAGRKQVYRLKEYLNELGITDKSFV